MSTTRPYPPGDRDHEPGARGGADVPGGAGAAGTAGTAGKTVTRPSAPGPAPHGGAAVLPDAVLPDTVVADAVVADTRERPPAAALPDTVGRPPAAVRSDEVIELSEGAPVGQARRLSFDDASGLVPMARDFARQALYAWGWMPAATADQRAAAEDVLLVVSELVTNACLHAEGPQEMSISVDRKVLRVEVTDRGSGTPAPRTPHRAGRPGGHGMFIVQRLCLDWGVTRTPGAAGKTVWAELGAPA